MATYDEMWDTLMIETDNHAGIALLKCTSTYPARLDEMNLSTIPEMVTRFSDIPIGLSDHSMNPLVPSLAVALGACIIEAHLQTGEIETLDSAFSWEPPEFRMLVKSIRETEQALGTPFAVVEREQAMRAYRRIEGKRGASV
jgi:pseudaminic acid synthase